MSARSSFSLVSVSRPGLSFLRDRLQGSGGWYNLGNAIGLAVGLGLQIRAVGTAQGGAGYPAAYAPAVALTLATLFFFWSGEVYHRAWAKGAPPDARLNRLGDLSSALGALVLGSGLKMLGQPLLALFSGLLRIAGPFGTFEPC